MVSSSKSDEWYYKHGGQIFGPVSSAVIFQAAISGIVRPNSEIRRGTGPWQTAAAVGLAASNLISIQVAQGKQPSRNPTEWYYQHKHQEIVGPLTSEQLSAATVDGNVKPDTLVRCGSGAWQPAAEVKGLFEWYYKGWFKEVGPHTTAQLTAAAEAGTVKPDTQVRRGSGPWQAASEVKGLFEWYYKGRFKEVGPLLKSAFFQAAREGSIKPDTLIRQRDGNWKPASELKGLFEWYYKRKNKEIGPLLVSDFFKAAREGNIKPDTLVRKGNEPWKSAIEVKDLFEWYYQRKGKEIGPLLATDFFKAAVDGSVKSDTLIRKGDGLWQPASKLEGFFDKVQQARTAKARSQFRTFLAAARAAMKLAALMAENQHDLEHNSSEDSHSDFNDSSFENSFETDSGSGFESDSSFDNGSDINTDSGYDESFSFDNDSGFSSDFSFDSGSGFDSSFVFDGGSSFDGSSSFDNSNSG